MLTLEVTPAEPNPASESEVDAVVRVLQTPATYRLLSAKTLAAV